jgi:GT2 family glycosyltransferase
MQDFVNRSENDRLGMGAFLASHLQGHLDTYVVHNCFGLPLIYADFGYLERRVLEEVGYLDLGYRKYFWDLDLALKIWATGRKVLPCPGACIKHYFIEDDVRRSGEELREGDFLMFRDKWSERVKDMGAVVYRDRETFALITGHLEEGSLARVYANARETGDYAA